MEGKATGWNDGGASNDKCAWDDFNCTLDDNDCVLTQRIISESAMIGLWTGALRHLQNGALGWA